MNKLLPELAPASATTRCARNHGTKHRRTRAAARRQERVDRDLRETAWASELLAVLGDEPLPMKHVLERLGWKRDTTVKRIRTLEDGGLVERVNYGTTRRTVLWRRAPTPVNPPFSAP